MMNNSIRRISSIPKKERYCPIPAEIVPIPRIPEERYRRISAVPIRSPKTSEKRVKKESRNPFF